METELKEKHYRIILKALDNNKNALQIAEDSGLTQHQVSRRMSELISKGRVKTKGKMNVNRSGKITEFTVYEKNIIN